MTKKLIIFSGLLFSFSAHAFNLPSTDLLKRGGKHCTGVCDQPSQVCGNNKELYKWCKEKCGHKINVKKLCKKSTAAVGTHSTCKTTLRRKDIQMDAALSTRAFNPKGPLAKEVRKVFKKISYLDDEKGTGLVAYAGVKDCILYISFRGSTTARDWLGKDVQLGVANLLDTVKLGQLASRGGYNNAVNKGVEFFYDVTKKAAGQFSAVSISGFSLGGAYAASVGDRVGREQKNILVFSFDAPGSNFSTNKVGGGDQTVNAHHTERGDIVGKIGKHTPGKRQSTKKRARSLADHNMENTVKALRNQR